MKQEHSLITLAKEKAGNIPMWEPYLFERIDNGILITGCLTSIKKSGKDKGGIKFLIKEGSKKIFIEGLR